MNADLLRSKRDARWMLGLGGLLGKQLASGAVAVMKWNHVLSRVPAPKGVYRWILAILVGALLGVGAGHTVKASFSGSVSVVDGVSMLPTYPPGTRVYTAPISGDLARGDVVLVDDGKSEYALKRIVGLPGETVQFWRGYVFIDRRMLREPYLPKHTYTFPDERNEIAKFKLLPSQFFVLGDNRNASTDSRLYGPVERDQIKSRVPLSEAAVRPRLVWYTLPNSGKRTIRAIDN